MKQKTPLQTSPPEPQRIPIDWTDSDWFRVGCAWRVTKVMTTLLPTTSNHRRGLPMRPL